MKQVAEDHACERQPDPGVDQDERGREVVERRAATRVAGDDHEREQRDPEQSAERPHGPAPE